MMGIKGPGRKITDDDLRQLWNDLATGADLRRIGIEFPQQSGALFLMDGEEINLITREVAPLRDNYPTPRSDRGPSASKYQCKKLIYYEHYRDVRDAIARESQLKKWSRAKKVEPTLGGSWC